MTNEHKGGGATRAAGVIVSRARGWSAVEYIDQGVSGAKDRRPALDQLAADVRRHKVQSVVCWRLDRLVATFDISFCCSMSGRPAAWRSSRLARESTRVPRGSFGRRRAG